MSELGKQQKLMWFVNKDAAPLSEYGTHLRTIKQAEFFSEHNYQTKVFCSARVHNTDINHIQKGYYLEENIEGVDFVFIKSLAYKNNGAKRMLAYLFFSLNLIRYAIYHKKPDVLVHTTRIPFDFPITILSKCSKIKYIVDVTDMWPWEFLHFGYLKETSLVLKFFYYIEKQVYKKADYIVSSLQGFSFYLKEHKWDDASGGPVEIRKVHYVNNGVSLHEFKSNQQKYSLHDTDIENDTYFKCIYLGSIREANNLNALIEAAKYLLDYKNIKFLIYGDGPEREKLIEKCLLEGISNVIFKEKWIRSEYVPYVVSHASINILNYAEEWATYGGSMNKMFMGFASERPLICNAGMKFSLIRDYHAGIDQKFNNAKEYANAILHIYNLDEDEYMKICECCKVAAQEHDIRSLNEKFKMCCGL